VSILEKGLDLNENDFLYDNNLRGTMNMEEDHPYRATYARHEYYGSFSERNGSMMDNAIMEVSESSQQSPENTVLRESTY
jgi:hypothetical protein